MFRKTLHLFSLSFILTIFILVGKGVGSYAATDFVDQFILDDRNPLLKYSSDWHQWSHPFQNYYKATMTNTDNAGSSMEYQFSGTGIRYVGIKNSDLGMAAIYLDNVYQTTVDLYHSTGMPNVPLYDVNNLDYGQHTIRIVVLGQKNPLSTAAYVVIDAFVVYSDFPQSGETIKPVISGFQVLYTPKLYGDYINDHTVVKHTDGSYHLIGITSKTAGSGDAELYLAHGVGDSLTPPISYVEKDKLEDDGKGSWAPHIVKHDGVYYMYYASHGVIDASEVRSSDTSLRLSTSTDLYSWTDQTSSLSVNRLGRFNRDPMLLNVGSTWIMYNTWIDEEGKSVVSYFESTDLYNWTFGGYALSVGENAISAWWGSTESPFVFYKDGYYYLSVTITNGNSSNYNHTYIFRSTNPRAFGYWNGYPTSTSCEPVTRLIAHAPEYILEDGKWHITTSGWRDKSAYWEAKRGAAISELNWVTQ